MKKYHLMKKSIPTKNPSPLKTLLPSSGSLLPTFFLLLALFGLSLVSACGQQQEQYRIVGAEDFNVLIADPEVQRVDVRTVVEYSEGHIPGAININVLDTRFGVAADVTLHKDQPVAIYCRSGRRSQKAARILTERGFTVIELEGGLNAWEKAGLPTEL